MDINNVSVQEMEQFVARFSANASKAKQATSRAKQIEKIQLDEIGDQIGFFDCVCLRSDDH